MAHSGISTTYLLGLFGDLCLLVLERLKSGMLALVVALIKDIDKVSLGEAVFSLSGCSPFLQPSQSLQLSSHVALIDQLEDIWFFKALLRGRLVLPFLALPFLLLYEPLQALKLFLCRIFTHLPLLIRLREPSLFRLLSKVSGRFGSLVCPFQSLTHLFEALLDLLYTFPDTFGCGFGLVELCVNVFIQVAQREIVAVLFPGTAFGWVFFPEIVDEILCVTQRGYHRGGAGLGLRHTTVCRDGRDGDRFDLGAALQFGVLVSFWAFSWWD